MTNVIIHLPLAIMLNRHVKRERADDKGLNHHQISSTNVIVHLDPAIVPKTHMERKRKTGKVE